MITRCALLIYFFVYTSVQINKQVINVGTFEVWKSILTSEDYERYKELLYETNVLYHD